MRNVIAGPLRHRTNASTQCASLWAFWANEPRHRRPLANSTSAQHAPSRAARTPTSSSASPSRTANSAASLPAAAAAATSGHAAGHPSPAMTGGADSGAGEAAAAFHVLAFCRTSEDAARVRDVAKEIASASCPTGSGASAHQLHLHLDGASAPPPDALPAFDAAGCARRLAAAAAAGAEGGGGGGGGTRVMGRVLLAAATLGSTQELLRSRGSALGDGAVAVADRQTSGKGRGGNQWTSPLGCLMFSALRRLRVSSPAQAPFINYLVCLAVTRGVRRALQECSLPPLELRIKWPNDIYAGGVKVAGALIHTTWHGGCFNVITGIGLNVNNRTPTTCLDELIEATIAGERQRGAAVAAASGGDDGAAAASGCPPVSYVSREAVLTGILTALEEVYDRFEAGGFAPLESEYLDTWLHSGQVLDFDDSDPSAPGGSGSVGMGDGSSGGSGGRITRLTIRGLSPSGFLLAEDAGGARYELTPDGNSLDMMRGLIRRKVQ